MLLSLITAMAVVTAAPSNLSPPGNDQVLKLSVQARGEQVYECAAVSPPQDVGWRALGPRAVLLDDHGATFGQHYAGPTWEASDGSKVVGQVIAKAPGPDGSGVDWLLLRGTSSRGAGALSGVSYVRRLNTKGGLPPATGCSPGSEGRQVQVPYSATYEFYEPQR